MRIFAIKDETMPEDQILGYLIYYENARAFYIELPDDADPWDIPPILSSFVKRGERSIGSYWSRIWVEQRIIPQERQNIGQILKENGLKEYDEFSLLLLSMGRCAQDDCYLEEIPVGDFPQLLRERWNYKIEDVVPMEVPRLLIFFRNGEVRVADMQVLAGERSFIAIAPYLASQERFMKVEVQTDGYGVTWNETASISDRKLYEIGVPVPLSLQDFCHFVQYRLISTSETCRILDCSRQNIDDLTRRGKLHPVRMDAKNKLFLKNEVLQRKKRVNGGGSI